jgi:hypothetical protein
MTDSRRDTNNTFAQVFVSRLDVGHLHRQAMPTDSEAAITPDVLIPWAGMTPASSPSSFDMAPDDRESVERSRVTVFCVSA